MASTTPIYGWPYQGLTDPPNGATLGQGLALAAEATVSAIRTDVTALQSSVTTITPYRVRNTLSGVTASVAFTSIPTTLRRITIYYTARVNAAASVLLAVRINNDSGAARYLQHDIGANDVAMITPEKLSAINWSPGLVAGNANANEYSSGTIDIVGWDSPHTAPLCMTFTSAAIQSAGGAGYLFRTGGGIYTQAGPYNRIDFIPASGSFEAGSDFLIEGW